MIVRYVRNPGATAQVISAVGAKLSGWHIFNGTSAQFHVQFFDAAAIAGVTVGTTVPKMVLTAKNGVKPLEALSAFDGIEFQNGIVIAVTTEDDNSTGPTYDTALATGDVNLFLL